MKHSLAEHLGDVSKWWMLTYGRQDGQDREWCRMVAYERWVNGKELLTVDDPPVPWYTKTEAVG